jgi:hypothetical protein
MSFTVSNADAGAASRGAQLITAQIRSLYKAMLGDDLPADHPEIVAIYDLLTEAWEDRRTQPNNASAWSWPEEECLFPRELSDEEWQRVGADPQQMLYSWISVMHYLLTHFDYLHE